MANVHCASDVREALRNVLRAPEGLNLFRSVLHTLAGRELLQLLYPDELRGWRALENGWKDDRELVVYDEDVWRKCGLT